MKFLIVVKKGKQILASFGPERISLPVYKYNKIPFAINLARVKMNGKINLLLKFITVISLSEKRINNLV